jgi:hypothetical protein
MKHVLRLSDDPYQLEDARGAARACRYDRLRSEQVRAELIARAPSTARDGEREMQHHMLFCALALDYLLGAHPDADLRKLVIEDYKETVKDWERPRVD